MPKNFKIKTQEFSDSHFTSFNIDVLISKRDVILTEAKKIGIQDVYICKDLGSTATLCFQVDISSSTTQEQINKFKNFIKETLKYESEIIFQDRKTLAGLLNFQVETQQRDFRSVLNSAIPLSELRSNDPLEKQLEEEWSEFSNIIGNSSLSDEKKISLLEPLYQSDINLIYLKGALSALHIATQNCGVRMAQWLLQKCPDLIWSGKIDRGGNVLDFAAMNSNVELFDYFLSQDENQILLSQKNFEGATLLHYAVMGNNVTILKKTIELLKLHNINTLDHLDRYPIHYACRNFDNGEIIEFLVKHGAKLTSKTREGKYPIHFLAEFNSFNKMQKFSTLTVLAGFDIDINQRTSTQRETVLHLLLYNLIRINRNLDDEQKISQYLNIIEAFIQYGLNPFIKNAKGVTALNIVFRMLTDLNKISYCNFAFELLHVFSRNGIMVENEIFINELSYLENPIIKFGHMTGDHLKKLLKLLIEFFPYFYCRAFLNKVENSHFHHTVNYTMDHIRLLTPIQNMLENVCTFTTVFPDEPMPNELIEYCQILLAGGFLINVTLSEDELKILLTLQTSLKKGDLIINKPQSAKWALEIIEDHGLYLKIISRILVYKILEIKQECHNELKLILFDSLSKVSIKDWYETAQFLLDHPEMFDIIKFTKEEVNELEKNRINSYCKLYEFPRLTFFAVNKLMSANRRFLLNSKQHEINLRTNLDVIGKSVPRVKENRKKILSLFLSR